MSTLEYYQHNAVGYVADTLAVDMGAIYSRFESHLQPGAFLLDAGCGSGRDAKYFIRRGYHVTAMDPCEALAHSAEILIGQPVERVCFQQMHWLARFDGIWACASLLHVPENQLEEVFQRVCRALKHGGVFYVSFKYGQSERMKEGRLFTDMNEARLKHVVEEVNGCGGCGQMQIVETWLSGDVRSGRSNEQWLNGLLRKTTGKEGKDQDLL